jgi:predicted ATPase
VGAYRDNEVDTTHPLSVSLREIERKGGKVEDLQLLPLSDGQVAKLVDDTFNTNIGMPYFSICSPSSLNLPLLFFQ